MKITSLDSVLLARYSIPLCLGIIVFGNHYIRDSVGALEKQIESDLNFSPSNYALLNSLFFAPNIITPLIAGAIMDKLGGPAVSLFLAVTVANIGHFIFCSGVETISKSFPKYSQSGIFLMFFGRTLAGSLYEVVDSLEVVVMGTHYRDNWATICGFINSFLRLGSVFNFLISPIVYDAYGISYSLWFAFLIVFFGNFIAVLVVIFDRTLTTHQHSLKSSSETHNASIEFRELPSSDRPFVIEGEEGEEGEGEGEGEGNGVSIRIRMNNNRQDGLETGIQDILSDDRDESTTWPSKSQVPSPSPQTILTSLHDLFPWTRLSAQYYFFALCGACLYGSMVPFWFMGSKYLQDYYSMSVIHADHLMLLPEGAIVLVSMPVGLCLDRFGWSLKKKLVFLSFGCFILPLSYFILIFSAPLANQPPFVSPYLSMGLLGLGYALSNSLFWGNLTTVIGDPSLLGAGNGLICSLMNLLPAAIPPLVSSLLAQSPVQNQGPKDVDGKQYLMVLAFVGLLATTSSLFSAFSGDSLISREPIDEDPSSFKSSHPML